MKLNKLAVAVGAAVLGLSSVAQAELSANIGATSNYIWRGVSQTDDQAAISGGLDYGHESGFYLGTWASNVDFGDDATAEVDLYGGYSGAAGDFGYDVGVIYYMYPGEEYDFAELAASVSFGPVTGGINYNFWSDTDDDPASNDLFIEGDIYYYLSAGFEVAPTWTVGGTIGYFDFDDDGALGSDTSYKHIQIDIGKSAGDFGDFTFSVSKADKESGDDDAKVFVSWAKSF